jgi:glutaredoxin-related protein
MVERIFSQEFEKTLPIMQTKSDKSVEKLDIVGKVDAMRKSARKENNYETLPQASLSGLSSLLLKIGQISSMLDSTSSVLALKSGLQTNMVPTKVLEIAASKATRLVQTFEKSASASESTLDKASEKLKDKKGLFHSLFSGIAMVFSLKAATVGKKKQAFIEINRKADQAPASAAYFMLMCINSCDEKNTIRLNEMADMVQDYLIYVSGLRALRAANKEAAQNASLNSNRALPTPSDALSFERKSTLEVLDDFPTELQEFHSRIVSIEHQLDKVIMHIDVILVNVDGLKQYSQGFLSQLTQIISQLNPTDKNGIDDFQVNQDLTNLNQMALDHQQFCKDILEVIDYTLEVLFSAQQEMDSLPDSVSTQFTPQMESLITTATSSYGTLFEELTGALVHLGQGLESLQEASSFELGSG